MRERRPGSPLALGRKQSIREQGQWRSAIDQARASVSAQRLDQLVEQTLALVRQELEMGMNVAYAWSGGKDSQVLRWVMEQVGVDRCVIGMTIGLEWPAMLAWITEHMPGGCDVVAVDLDLPWLARRPEMLFPQGRHGPRWFQLVQHRAQREFVRARSVELLALGRRRADGNFIGRAGADRYTDRHGVTRWSPLAGWSHEEVFALLARENLPLPPCYDWPRGFQVGTGPWPARQWTASVDDGFAECWQIDPQVVREAAEVLPPAARWLERTGRS